MFEQPTQEYISSDNITTQAVIYVEQLFVQSLKEIAASTPDIEQYAIKLKKIIAVVSSIHPHTVGDTSAAKTIWANIRSDETCTNLYLTLSVKLRGLFSKPTWNELLGNLSDGLMVNTLVLTTGTQIMEPDDVTRLGGGKAGDILTSNQWLVPIFLLMYLDLDTTANKIKIHKVKQG